MCYFGLIGLSIRTIKFKKNRWFFINPPLRPSILFHYVSEDKERGIEVFLPAGRQAWYFFETLFVALKTNSNYITGVITRLLLAMRILRILFPLIFFLLSLLSACKNGAMDEEKPGRLTDEELIDLVQKQTLMYFLDFAHPVSGLIPERNTTPNVVTTGGTGFGLMALLAGVERGWVSREEALSRLDTMVKFLENADRFHGVWPHWMNGTTGKTIPFSPKDNGGDLVETAFLVQGLLAVRQYFDRDRPEEMNLRDRINGLWESVEWDWYTRGQQVLYWHWSPEYQWEMNMPVVGYNEALIVYILAVSSPTHPVAASVYEIGWKNSDHYINGGTYYGMMLPLGYDYGGPLFFAHYSFLGLDPRGLSDGQTDYWIQNKNHTLINRAYCIDNPKKYKGYGPSCWGLTASDNYNGYSAHSPTNDLGVITPTAAISSLPYAGGYSMQAIRYFYETLGDRLWGKFGFYDAFSEEHDWFATSYLAIDQGPIVIMIENYRTGLLWDLFMSAPEIRSGLAKLGFTSSH